MSGWIQTYSGQAFDPESPDPNTIHIYDIAVSLSRMPRFMGHSTRFLSVAEHCVNVAEMAPYDLKLTALMHDASEAYLVDIPRPIKPLLKGYTELEDKIMRVIADKFGFEWPMPDIIKELDTRHLWDEGCQNMSTLADPDKIWNIPFGPTGIK